MTRNKRSVVFMAALAAASLIISLPALAGGPLAVFQSGQPFLWPNGGANIEFNPDQGGFGGLTNAQAVLMTENAFGQWGSVPTSTASYTNAGLLPVDVDATNFVPWLNPSAPDGLSAIVFDEDGSIFDLLFGPGSGVLGFAGPEWVDLSNGTILEGLTFFNGSPLLSGSINMGAQRTIAVHEFGHYTNLAHTVTNGEIAAFGDNTGPSPFNTFPPESLFLRIETMYPFALILPDGSDFGGGETLNLDDTSILSTLYPAPGFFTDFGSISGTILSPDGITKLTGVNVIARNVTNPYDDAVSALSSDFTDNTFQADPVVGTFTFNGLTPGAQYAIYVDQLLAGGFSTPPLFPLPGPEELYNGADESFDSSTDDPSIFTGVASVAGTPTTGVNIVFNRPGPGDPLLLGDDDNIEIVMPFTFKFCGEDYDSAFINSNGSVTFGAGSNDFSESTVDMLGGLPRIAGLWDDLNPAQGGVVTFFQTQDTFTASWTDVPEFFSTGANTFEIVLYRSSNQIDLIWGGLTATDGMAGFSCGEAAATGQEPSSDLTQLAADAEDRTINGRRTPAIYELFNFANPGDLSGDAMTFTAPKEFKDKNEPNNSLGEATGIKLPFSSGDQIGNSSKFRFTDISPEGNDVDYFAFTASAGNTLLTEIISGGLDSLVGLFDAGGTLLATDDDGGAGLLSRLQFVIPADGIYVLAVTTFPDFDFDGDGNSSGRYVLEIEETSGIILSLGDDDSQELALPFTFPFQGQTWNSVFVNSNGNLTFGTGNTDFSESVSEFLSGPPRIAALWDDLSPNNGGTVTVDFTPTSVTITFDGVPEFFSTGANTFSYTLHDDGDVNIDYGPCTSTDGIVGVTGGNGAADPGETDLSAGGPLPVLGTTYEQFLGDFDLANLSVIFQ